MTLNVRARIAIAMTILVAANIIAGAASAALYSRAATSSQEARVAAERAKRAAVASQAVTQFFGNATDMALAVSRATPSEERSRIYGSLIGQDLAAKSSVRSVDTLVGSGEAATPAWERMRLATYLWINSEASASGADFRITKDARGAYRSSISSNLSTPAALAGKTGQGLRQAVLSEAEHMQYAVLGALSSKAEAEALSAAGSESAARENAQRITLLLVALSILVAIVLGLWLYRGIVRPLGVARDYADRVAAGEYSATLGRHSDDEIGALTRAVENMKDGLVREMEVMREMAGAVMITTEGIRSSVGDIERVSLDGAAASGDVGRSLADVGQQSDLLLELATQMLGA